MSLGQVLASQKKYTESYQVFEELSKLAPSNLGIQMKMALILAEQKQFDKAKEFRPGPSDPARLGPGSIPPREGPQRQGKLDEAEKEFVQLQGQPTFLNSRVMLSSCSSR
jgi:hypothetical protein